MQCRCVRQLLMESTVHLEVRVLKVAAPGHPIRYGMFFGAAAIYQGIQYFHRNVNGRGFRGEVGPGLTILRFLWALVNKNKDFTASAANY